MREILLLAVGVASGCKGEAPREPGPPAAATAPAPNAVEGGLPKGTTRPPFAPSSSEGFEPIAPGSFVFIGRARTRERLDCAKYESPDAPHRRPPQQLHDATDFPERHRVDFELLEVLEGPAPTSLRPSPRGGDSDAAMQASVSFALGTQAYFGKACRAPAEAYDRRYCERLNAVLDADFAVLVAYPIYVDRGNSLDPGPWFSLGTDPGKPNAAFRSLEEARSYVAKLPRTAE